MQKGKLNNYFNSGIYFYLPPIYILFLFFFLSNNTAKSQEPPKKEEPTTRILFIFDASQSMLGLWGTQTKMEVAKEIFYDLLDSLKEKEKLELALRIYGHQKPVPPQDCNDTRLEIPFGPYNIDRIKGKLDRITPKGTTPLAKSLEEAAKDFGPCNNCRNLIILITDGIESCDGDPCKISLGLQQKGIVIRPFVIGIGLNIDFKSAFECIGEFYNASDREMLRNVLKIVINQALDQTTCQVSLLDIYNKPTETNIPYTFFNYTSGKAIYNYVHTLNTKGNPDTLVIDALTTYNLKVHTMPPVTLDSIKLTPGEHTIIPLSTPQGILQITPGNRSDYKELTCIIKQSGQDSILNVQQLNSSASYLVGNYDIEVLTLPRLYIDKVAISQSHTTTIEIPQPGILSVSLPAQGVASILLESENQLTAIYHFPPNKIQESLLLLPGNYRLVYRPKSANNTLYSTEKIFTITAGQSSFIKL